jgi:hypothetical protein
MSADEPRYETVEPREREEILKLLDSGNPSFISTALYSATYHDGDWEMGAIPMLAVTVAFEHKSSVGSRDVSGRSLCFSPSTRSGTCVASLA